MDYLGLMETIFPDTIESKIVSRAHFVCIENIIMSDGPAVPAKDKQF